MTETSLLSEINKIYFLEIWNEMKIKKNLKQFQQYKIVKEKVNSATTFMWFFEKEITRIYFKESFQQTKENRL